MIVMVIIGILAAFAVPSFIQHVRSAREAVLREDLHTMRTAIDSYTVDKQKAPQTLDDLVQAGYLKAMPKDPITQRTDTWVAVQVGHPHQPRPDRSPASTTSTAARRRPPLTAPPTPPGSRARRSHC